MVQFLRSPSAKGAQELRASCSGTVGGYPEAVTVMAVTPRTAGLSSAEAARRLQQDGANELQRAKTRSIGLLVASQLKSPMIALLVGAAVVSAVLGDGPECAAIVAIVVLNAAVGVLQERRAERAVFALRSLTAPRARVLRDGQPQVIPAREVVVGDLLLLEGGDLVAADAELVEAQRLTTVEATLTGEPLPSEKSTGRSAAGAPLADQHDRVFMGTSVATGVGRAVVTSTGARTELGHIAHLLETATEELTPLQTQLARVGQALLWLCLAAVALVAGLGLARGAHPLELLVPSLSLAVAAVPEGLPAIVTIALAIGVQRMARRNVLVRRLPSVETLGCTTVIATDKTGTLTTGTMTVREVWGHEPSVLKAAVACCDAELGNDGGGDGVGDPTELALLAHAATLGIRRAAVEAENPRVSESPFDSWRKRMSVLRRDGTLFVKGAVESVVPQCLTSLPGWSEVNHRMTHKGLRVLAVAHGNGPEEAALTLDGLVGLSDPPRPEAIEAIKTAKGAGIRTVMITGDHPHTAVAVARELGLVSGEESAVGVVHARVAPEDKLRIVRELKAAGEIVAMTGDGANDAPALKEAHVGIAMGKTGAEVAREAADMVLSDDNIASIIAAVREGRAIYANIRKSLVYLLGTAVANIAVVLGAALASLPAPLLPLHLLWINLVTGGLPALALVMDPSTEHVLSVGPRPPQERMLRRREWLRIFALGLAVGAVGLTVYLWLVGEAGVLVARTMTFSTMVVGQVLTTFAARSHDRVHFELGAFTNVRLLAVIAGTGLLQAALVAFPPSVRLLQLAPFEWPMALGALLLGLLPVSALEGWKLLRRGLTPL